MSILHILKIVDILFICSRGTCPLCRSVLTLAYPLFVAGNLAQNPPANQPFDHVARQLNEVAANRLENEQMPHAIEPIVPAEQFEVAYEVELANEIDPNIQLAQDLQFAQDLQMAFNIEMEDILAERNDVLPAKERQERTKHTVSRLSYFKCATCQQTVQADDLPDLAEIDYVCGNCVFRN